MAEKSKAVCPKCGKTLEYLREFDLTEVEYEVRLTDDDGLEYQRTDYIGDADRIEFVCPECSATLPLLGEADALAFLQGE